MLKCFAASILLLATCQANAALVSGDIAFTSFNADEDGFSLVPFVNIDVNTTIFFTDNEWNGAAIGAGGAFNTGESYLQWNTGTSVISAGTLVRFSDEDKTSLAASFGTFSRVVVAGSSNYGLANSTETLYAYLGVSATAPSAFLTAITNGNFASDGSITNTGLIQGASAMDLNGSQTTSPDYGEYNGIRAGLASIEAYKPLIADVNNWLVDSANGTYTTQVPNTQALTAVPVPAAVWLLASALVGLAGLSRRKV